MNCARRGLSCGGYTSGPLSRSMRSQLRAQRQDIDLTEAGFERRRLRGSCKACRSGKTKCSGDKPACMRCVEKGIDCSYDTSSEFSRHHSVPTHLYAPAEDESFTRSRNFIGAAQDFATGPISNLSGHTHLGGTFQDPANKDESYHSLVAKPEDTDSKDWFFSPALPSRDKVRQLVESYFTNIHPLRCYAFIHRPSFMEKLDQDSDTANRQNPLLHVICALGAKFLAYDTLKSPRDTLAAGSQWAKTAQLHIFNNMNLISVTNLMATVLLHDHELRVGNYAAAFMLSGTAIRMSQALQINLEYSTDILGTEISSASCCERESRRRLMWSCYAPSITEMLTKGQVLKFVPDTLKPSNPESNIGIAAYFARIAGLRKKILRYIKKIDITQPPQLPDPEFINIEQSLDEWFGSLPSTLRFTTASIYIRKDSDQLGALFLLHCSYHISVCDFYRVSVPMLLPGLLRSWASAELNLDQQSFRMKYQRKCFEHARSVADIFAKIIAYGPKLLADNWLCTCAFESIRTMLYYTMQGTGQDQDPSRRLLAETIPHFKANMKAIRLMIPLFATAEQCYSAATALLRKAGIGPQLVEGTQESDDQLNTAELESVIDHSSPAVESPENVLNPLSIYALTRRDIDEKDAKINNPLPEDTIQDSPREPQTFNESGSSYAQQPWHVQSSNSVSSALPQEYSNILSQPNLLTPQNQYNPNLTSLWQQPSMQTSMDLPWMSFMSDFDGYWLPAETAQQDTVARGVPPWESILHMYKAADGDPQPK
ncbi:fungal-specific transcription factor domain-containing protein [Xylogone sp. PMI_703]|nr:fungal-specific transcription factor domain-containing protein [Xylogone sp. PMI_703]